VALVGVRTATFGGERGEAALRRAVARLGISHPVVDDPDGDVARRYGVKAWPTVVVVDRAGDVVGSARGEGAGPVVERAVAAALTGGATPGLESPPAPAPPAGGELAWPAKVAVHPAGLVVADTGHGRVLVVTLDGRVVAEHGGLLGPSGVRAGRDGSLVVCERDGDRVVRLAAGGEPRVVLDGVVAPEDVAVGPGGELFVAEAGRHRIWQVDPAGAAAVLAGTGEEGLEDGYGPQARLAQPSGLAVGPQGLFVVDAAASALRVVDARNRVATLIGRGLAAWGDADGPAPVGRLQHPEGVACAPDGYSLYVADTYNAAIRLWSGVDGELRTAPVEGLVEPGGLDVLPDGRLAVADTGGGRVVLVDLAAGTVEPLAIG
jgi:DNA-binding beta-propeller fold protein YncE